MPRSYTRTGDKGETGRIGPQRRKKSDQLYEVVGTLDEFIAWIGFAASCTNEQRVIRILHDIQQFLFCAGADVATPLDQACRRRIREDDTKKLEKIIKDFEKDLADLRNFILPAGTQAVTALHVARAVARRAERATVKFGESEELNRSMVPFLNRLSSLLFLMARWLHHQERGKEEHPTYNP